MPIAEAIRPEVAVPQEAEEYAQSLYALRQLGRLAMEGQAEDYDGAETFAYDDFLSAVGENLKTDSETRHCLDIEPIKVFEIRNGRVVASDGRDMEELVQEGWITSRKAAEVDPRMQTQVIRDEGDVLTARTVNSLRPGESYTAVSMDPKDAMVRDGKKFWEGKGYRSGMAFIQFYYKHPGGGLLTGSYSAEFSDQDAWRAVLARHDVEVPDGISTDNWIRYGDRRSMTPEQAKTYSTDLRSEYYAEIGKTHRRISVTELLDQRREVIDRYFDTYMRPLALAIATGENNQTMQSFAAALMRSQGVMEKLAAKSRQELTCVSNSGYFTAESGRLMEELVRYATVEELRKDLMHLLSGRQSSVLQGNYNNRVSTDRQLELMNLQAAGNIGDGLMAGRSYGGCSSAGEKAADEADVRDDPQDVFGGREAALGGSDRFGSRKFQCPKGHWNERPFNKFISHCKHCGTEVACGHSANVVDTSRRGLESLFGNDTEVRIGQILGIVLEAFVPEKGEALNYN